MFQLICCVFFRFFLFYFIILLFLPLDRFSGTCLDAINKPQFTFYKVIFMVTINFMGDILVLNWFGSLEGIAIVTIINVTAGALSGYFFLRKRLKLVLKDFVTGAKSVFSKIKLFIIPGS